MCEFSIAFTSETGNRRRYRFEKRPVHEQWHRYEEEHDAGEWRPVGHEIVEDLNLQVAGDVLAEAVEA